MNDVRKSRTRYAIDCADGLQVRGYALYGADGAWLGDVALDYSAARRQLRLYCVTDYGNYAYRWDGAGNRGYADFLLNAGNEYIVDKLATGHGEDRVILPTETQDAIWSRFQSSQSDEDPDWLGEALYAPRGCACEADFFAWAEEHAVRDVYTDFRYGWGGYLPGLCQRVLPELKRVLRKEVGAE